MATEPAALETGPTPDLEPEATDVPAEASADVPAEPTDGQAVQEPTEEPTSEVVAAPPDVFDRTDPDVAFIIEKYGDDPNRLARELHAANNRNAEMARGREAAPDAPAEELRTAQPSADSPEAEQAAHRSAKQDEECVSLREDYLELGAQIAEIAVVNRRGDLVGGELLTVDREIQTLNQDYETTKMLIAGKGRVQLDEFQKTELKNTLAEIKEQREDLKEKRQTLVDRYGSLRAARKDRSDKYQQRFDAYKAQFSKHVQSTRAKQEEERIVKGIQTEFTKEWNAGIDAAFKSLKIPNDPELRKELIQRARDAGKLTVVSSAIPTGGSQAFIENVLRREMKTGDYWRRHGVGAYAGQKRADVRPQAPSGRAAVAPADPANSTNWKDRWAAKATEIKERFAGGSAKEVYEKATGRPTV